MRKNSGTPADTLPKRRRTKRGDAVVQPNYHELISSLPKHCGFISELNGREIHLAERLLRFCEIFFKNEVAKLKFSEDHSIEDLINKLVTIINKKKLSIDTGYEHGHDSVCVLYELPWRDMHWYNMDGKYIENIPPALRPGYAKLLQMFSEQIDDYQSDFLSGHLRGTSHMDEVAEFEMSNWEEELDPENEEYPDYIERLNEVSGCLNEYRRGTEMTMKYLKKYNSYEFEKIIPKNKKQKELHELLREGLFDRNFNVIDSPTDLFDARLEGGVSYKEMFIMPWDCNSYLEYTHMQFVEERGNEGCSGPAGWYSLKEDRVQRGLSKEYRKEFEKVCEYIYRLMTFMNENFEKPWRTKTK